MHTEHLNEVLRALHRWAVTGNAWAGSTPTKPTKAEKAAIALNDAVLRNNPRVGDTLAAVWLPMLEAELPSVDVRTAVDILVRQGLVSSRSHGAFIIEGDWRLSDGRVLSVRCERNEEGGVTTGSPVRIAIDGTPVCPRARTTDPQCGLTPRGVTHVESAMVAPAVVTPTAPPKTISHRKAAERYAEWTGKKSNPAWIGKLIRDHDPRLRVEADGRTTEDGVAILVAHVLAAKAQKNGAPKTPAEAPPSWNEVCPQCGEKTFRLIGPARVCPKCFTASLNLPD